MKKIALVIALALASFNSAYAQALVQQPDPHGLRFFVGAGLTAGGDRLARLEFTNGSSQDVRAGGFVQFGAGLDYRINDELSLQASVNFHVDDSTADNGDVEFRRMPIELIGYYHVSPQWRLGVGARYVGSAKLTSSGAASGIEDRFDNALGGIVEAEYLYSQQMGFKLRYVSEKYESKYDGFKVSGDHVGGFFNFYF